MMKPIIFLHIPRTGGMSLRKMMDDHYGQENIGRAWWGNHAGGDLTEEQQNKLAWYGHFRFGLHEKINRHVWYITIIRDPAIRFLSEYFRNHYKEKKGLSPLQLISNLDECFGYDKMGDNLQVRMLSGALPKIPLNESHVGQALDNIKKYFLYVGNTAYYAGIENFLRGLGWEFNEVYKINQGSVPDRIDYKEVLELIDSEHLALDYKLYRAIGDGYDHKAHVGSDIR